MLTAAAKTELKQACKLHGGIKSVATRIGVDPGNLNKWLNNKRSLPEQSIENLLKELGLQNGQPDRSVVHSWRINRVLLNDLSDALNVYFPQGAKLALAPWVIQGISLKDTFSIGHKVDTLYALTDGKVRAILRLPRALILHQENIGGGIHWKNGVLDSPFLDININNMVWVNGTPSVAEFDRAWGDTLPKPSGDLNKAFEDAGISYDEAINAIPFILKYRKGNPPKS